MIRSLVLAAALAFHTVAPATLVATEFTPVGGGEWTVSFTVSNDGSLPSIGGFTVYFPEADFTSMALEAHPSAWDTLVIQPDLGLPAAGFLDALALDPADALGGGDSVTGFVVRMSFLGTGAPGRLAYDIVDADFQVLYSGLTVDASSPPSPVPEPATLWLLLFAAAAGAASVLTRGCTPRLVIA